MFSFVTVIAIVACQSNTITVLKRQSAVYRMELKLSMDIKALRGPLCVWLPPPPGDRMWFSFLEPPQLQVTASPLVNNPCHPPPPLLPVLLVSCLVRPQS